MKKIASFLMTCVLFAHQANAQITVQKSDIQAIFTPGISFQGYSPPDTVSSINVGKTGGPNVYDFTGIAFTANPLTSIYSVSQVPLLAGHYPDSGITFGQSPSIIENNPILLFSGDTLKTLGQVYVSADSQIYRHNTPHEPVAIFPATYGATWNYTQTPGAGVETTYVGGVAVLVTTGWNSAGTATIDGYGTLRVGSYDLQCLRIRSFEVSPYTHQGFTYVTREGLALIIESTKDQPDTGTVQITGMFYIVGGPLVSVRWKDPVPEEFSLLQNYPNPFNPITQIRFISPFTSHVSLKIYDLLGREVATLLNRDMAPGSYEVRWDGRNMPTGVYFYRLDTGSFTETKKLVLLR